MPEIVPELVEEDLDGVEGADPLDGLEGADPLDGAEAAGRPGSGIAAGAAAVVAAGIGVVSLTGSWLGDVLAQRQTLIGQIGTANATADVAIKQRYTIPWHRTAFVSMGFAVAAIVIAAATLFLGRFVARSEAPVWVRAVAWGALGLGVVGLGVSAAMYFDVFAGAISVPAGN
jgi:hypothetical protein